MPTDSKNVSAGSDNQSPKIKVIHAWVDAVNAWKINSDDVGKFLSDKAYMHETLPRSLNRPVRNKQEWLQYFKEVMMIFKEWKLEITSIIEGTEEVSFHAKAKGISATGAPYDSEYMDIVKFDDLDTNEPKICHVKEFIDSGYSKEFTTQESERQAKLRAQ